MGLKLEGIVDFRMTPVEGKKGNDHYFFDFVDKNGQLTRLEVSFKKGYSPFKDDNMNTKWLKERQVLSLSKAFRDLSRPNELHKLNYC